MEEGGVENPAFLGTYNQRGDRRIETADKIENSTKADEGIETEETLDDCNCFGNSVPFLNKLRTPKWLLVFLSIGALIQGMAVNGFVNVVITTIEKRFGLESSQSGLVASSYDIGTLIVSIPVAYFGGRVGANKPKWIGAGLFILGAGSFIFALPHFLTGTYTYGDRSNGSLQVDILCEEQTEIVDDGCHTDNGQEFSGLSKYRYLLILGQLLHGFGSMPLFLLGITSINESVSKKVAPLYIGIFSSWFVIGPALGFIFGGALLNIFVDSVGDLDITPKSVEWVGAWWPGFLVAAALAILLSLPMSCFPASLNARTEQVIQEDNIISPKHLLRQLYRLGSNPIYVLVSLGEGLDDIVLFGMAAFLAKYMEHQYTITISAASKLTGILTLVSGGVGTFFGGWIVKKLELKRTSIILMCCLLAFMGLLTSFSFLLGCSELLYSGINSIPLQNHSVPFLTASLRPHQEQCSSHCSCSAEKFSPVCGSDNLMYFSPCLAGCHFFLEPVSMGEGGENALQNGNYTGCSCVGNSGTARKTKCTSDCASTYLIPFLIVIFLSLLFKFVAYTPMTVVVLRSVRQEDEGLALGLFNIANKLLGSIPGPLIFGYVFDRACLLWEPDCGEVGSCLLYDHKNLSLSLFGVMFTVKVIYVILLAISAWISKRDIDDTVDSLEEVPERICEDTSKTSL